MIMMEERNWICSLSRGNERELNLSVWTEFNCDPNKPPALSNLFIRIDNERHNDGKRTELAWPGLYSYTSLYIIDRYIKPFDVRPLSLLHLRRPTTTPLSISPNDDDAIRLVDAAVVSGVTCMWIVLCITHNKNKLPYWLFLYMLISMYNRKLPSIQLMMYCFVIFSPSPFTTLYSICSPLANERWSPLVQCKIWICIEALRPIDIRRKENRKTKKSLFLFHGYINWFSQSIITRLRRVSIDL